jgi:hypothetical protein
MEKYTITLGEIIENNIDIFDFDYPIFREEYRKTFEQHFIDFFLFDEIGFETVARFKHRLKIKLNLIMPYWNKIFLADELEQRILDNYDVTEVYTITTETNGRATSNSTNKNLFSNTPISKTDFEQVDYLDSLSKDIGDSTSSTEGKQVTTYENHKSGNYGVQTDADAIVKYWESLRKIEYEIFEELSSLFMGVY